MHLVKDEFFGIVQPADAAEAAPTTALQASEAYFKQKSVSCTCCKWKGKVGEAQKQYVFLSEIAEIEMFCPKCATYIGFITDEK